MRVKQKDAWNSLAQEIGGEFIPKKGFKRCKVLLNYKSFKIVLDIYTVNTGNSTVTYTRMQTMFLNKPEITFSIRNKNFLFKIGKFFGVSNVELKDTELNDHIVVRASDDYMIDEILAKGNIKSILLSTKRLNIRIPKKMKYNSNRMYSESLLTRIQTGIIKDTEVLKQWFVLYTEFLEAFLMLDITEDVEAENSVKEYV